MLEIHERPFKIYSYFFIFIFIFSVFSIDREGAACESLKEKNTVCEQERENLGCKKTNTTHRTGCYLLGTLFLSFISI